MLSKLNRIKKKKDFEIIFKKGKSFKNKLFILRFLKNNFNQSRFGFVVSQKVSKKAVIRNKIRRRLSEIIKDNLKNIQKPENNLDLVFISLPETAGKEFLAIKESVEELLIKAKIITKLKG